MTPLAFAISLLLLTVFLYDYLSSRQLCHGLLFDLLTNACLNAFIFLFGNLFANLAIGRISAKNVCINDCHNSQGNRNDAAKDASVGPRDRCQEQVKHKSPHGVEEKSKVDGDHDAKELELSFEAANQETSACGVDGENPVGEGW